MENIIDNIPAGTIMDKYPGKSGFTLARAISDAHEEKTGNRCVVRRVLDMIDQYEGRDREHYSFDVVELTE